MQVEDSFKRDSEKFLCVQSIYTRFNAQFWLGPFVSWSHWIDIISSYHVLKYPFYWCAYVICILTHISWNRLCSEVCPHGAVIVSMIRQLTRNYTIQLIMVMYDLLELFMRWRKWNTKIIKLVLLAEALHRRLHSAFDKPFFTFVGEKCCNTLGFRFRLRKLPNMGCALAIVFSGPLPLRSHKEQVTFSGPFLGVPSHLDYTRNRPEPS